jgi:hypothetical protein
LFYLAVVALGIFANLFVRENIHVTGDAAATATNIAEKAMLYRVAFVADIFMAISFLFVGMALYLLLRKVHKHIAGSMMVFVALGVGMTLINLVFHFGSLLVATDASYAAALGTSGADALSLLLVDMHYYGYYLAGVFFGLWLLPLGYLVYKSGMFPRLLGIFLIIACFAHLGRLLVLFLAPNAPSELASAIAGPAVIGEFWLAGYLLTKGVRGEKPQESPAV